MLIGSSSTEMEQKYIVVIDWHGRIEGNIRYIHIVQLWRKKVKEAKRRSIFLFYSIFY